MDDAKKLIHWAINPREQFDIEIVNFDWPKRYSLEQVDYSFKLKIGEDVYDGRGMSASSEVALTKAIVESIERTAVEFNNLNSSNGLAAHFNFELAKENALCELIERDLFLCNFLTPTSGVKKLLPEMLFPEISKCMAVLESKNVNLVFFEIGNVCERRVVIAIANGFKCEKPFGCVVGLGSHNKILNAISSAFAEVVRTTVTYIEGEQCDHWEKDEQDFFKSNNFSILEHKNLALSEQYANWLWDYYQEKEQYPIVANNFRMNDFNFESLKLATDFKDLGIEVVRVKSNLLQDLFFGKTTYEKINLDRLNNYINGNSSKKINFRTHPLA